MADHKTDFGIERRAGAFIAVMALETPEQQGNLNGKVLAQMKASPNPEEHAPLRSQPRQALVVHWPPTCTLTSNKL